MLGPDAVEEVDAGGGGGRGAGVGENRSRGGALHVPGEGGGGVVDRGGGGFHVGEGRVDELEVPEVLHHDPLLDGVGGEHVGDVQAIGDFDQGAGRPLHARFGPLLYQVDREGGEADHRVVLVVGDVLPRLRGRRDQGIAVVGRAQEARVVNAGGTDRQGGAGDPGDPEDVVARGVQDDPGVSDVPGRNPGVVPSGCPFDLDRRRGGGLEGGLGEGRGGVGIAGGDNQAVGPVGVVQRGDAVEVGSIGQEGSRVGEGENRPGVLKLVGQLGEEEAGLLLGPETGLFCPRDIPVVDDHRVDPRENQGHDERVRQGLYKSEAFASLHVNLSWS